MRFTRRLLTSHTADPGTVVTIDLEAQRVSPPGRPASELPARLASTSGASWRALTKLGYLLSFLSRIEARERTGS